MAFDVLCVVAHPDDEVLGCGGTLWKHHENGDRVRIHFMTTRGMEDQILKAWPGTIIHSKKDPPDQQFDILPLNYFVQNLEQEDYDPDVIYTHWPHDLNLDHAIIARAVLTVFRPKPDSKPRKIFAFEVLSSTEWSHGYEPFTPNWYNRLTTQHIAKKVNSMRCYASEIQEFPHPRSTTAIWIKARFRGAECGSLLAESLHLIRGVEG